MRGARRVGGAELHGCGVLHRVFAGLNLKRRPATQPPSTPTHESQTTTSFGPSRALRRRQATADAASPEEGERHQQEYRSDDDWGIARGHKRAEGEGTY